MSHCHGAANLRNEPWLCTEWPSQVTEGRERWPVAAFTEKGPSFRLEVCDELRKGVPRAGAQSSESTQHRPLVFKAFELLFQSYQPSVPVHLPRLCPWAFADSIPPLPPPAGLARTPCSWCGSESLSCSLLSSRLRAGAPALCWVVWILTLALKHVCTLCLSSLNCKTGLTGVATSRGCCAD